MHHGLLVDFLYGNKSKQQIVCEGGVIKPRIAKLRNLPAADTIQTAVNKWRELYFGDPR
jgi:hypothetical protein